MEGLIRTPLGTLSLTRTKQAEDFYCSRCRTHKKAKLKATWKKPDGTTVTICNGCYGWILAQGRM
jgi:hypothetical protein